MRVFQRSDRGKQWWIDVRFRGRRERFQLFTDRRISQALADRIERLIEYAGAGITPDRELQHWARRVDQRIAGRLYRLGLVGDPMNHAAKSLEEHLADYVAHLAGKRNTPHYVRDAGRNCRTILLGLEAGRFEDLTSERVQGFLRDRQERRPGISVCTSNHWIASIKGFVNWAVRTGRAVESPLGSLARQNAELDRRRERRVLSLDEFRRLLRAARTGPLCHGTSGEQRYWLYVFAATTGFRSNECRHLTVASFELEAEVPHVRLSARVSKRRRPDVCRWLPGWLVSGLRELFQAKMPSAPAFKMPDASRVCRMLRVDLAAALIPYRTAATAEHPRGMVFDFHALRHTFSTHAGAVIASPRDLQEVLRVSNLELVSRYTHPDALRIRRAMANMPDLSV